MTDRQHSAAIRKQWWRKLVPISIAWIIFVAINWSYNQAPYSRAEVTITNVVLFFAPLFVALYLTFAWVLHSRRRGWLIAMLLCGLLLFRLYDLTQPLTVLLLFVFTGFLEWYFSHYEPHQLKRLRRMPG